MAAASTGGRSWLGACWLRLRLLLLLVTVGLGGTGSAHAGHAEPATLTWAIDAHQMPSRVCGEQTVRIPIAVRNTGSETWSRASGDRLAYHWLSEHGDPVVLEGLRTELPGPVPPGATVKLQARVRIPDVPGRHRLQWAMVREGQRWYPSPQSGPAEVEVEVGEPAFRYRVIQSEVPATLQAGARARGRVTLRNVGCATWSPQTEDRLSYRFYDLDGRRRAGPRLRTELPRPVAPGEQVELTASIEAPRHPGLHHFAWTVVRENVAWFRGQAVPGPAPIVRIEPDRWEWSLEGHGVPTAMGVEQVVQVPVRVRNRGDRVWAGDHGDRVSYHWIDARGRMVQREGLRTELPHPVMPGQEADLIVRVATPAVPGQYRLVLEPVRENVRWFGRHAEPIPVRVEALGLSWQLLDLAAPSSWAIGRTQRIWVRIRNAGTRAWRPSEGDHVSYHWRDPEGDMAVRDGLRSTLPGVVRPGETVELLARVRAPPEAGRYRLQPAMVREHVSWYPPAHDPGAHMPQVEVYSLARWFQLGVVGITALLLAARRHPSWSRMPPWLDAVIVPGWTIIALFCLVVSFAEVVAIEPWRGAQWVAFSGCALWALPVALVRAQARPWVAAAIVTVASLLVVADVAYLHAFGSIVPLTALAAAHQVVDIGASAVAMLDRNVLAALPMVGAAWVLAAAWPKDARGRDRSWPVVLVLVILSMPATLRLEQALTGHLGRKVYSERDNVGRLGVLGAHMFEIARELRTVIHGDRAPAKAVKSTMDWFHARTAEARAPGFGLARGKNVLVIQAEALQRWVVGSEVAGREVTPFLNRWSQRSLFFTDVFDQTAQGVTSDAEYLMLTSQHPLEVGALAFLRADRGFRTLAHVLADHGYSTSSAHPYERGFWNRATLHPRYGFEHSVFRRELGPGPIVGWGLADGVFFRRMVPRLQQQPEPFFAFWITLSLHHPYPAMPRDLVGLDVGPLEGRPLGNYLQAMHYFDRSLSALVGQLREAGLLEDTMIVVYGDHDARLPMSPALLELAEIEAWDPAVPMALEQVPLFIRLPRSERHGRVTTAAGQIDIGPTILHYLGIPTPVGFVGRPIWAGREGFVALPGGSAADDGRLFVREGQGIGGEGACFQRPSRSSRPRSDCRDLARRAATTLRHSRRVLQWDLFSRLARPPAR